MLKHEDFDAYDRMRVLPEVKLPKKSDSISVSHDGGRLYIRVNGEVIFKAFEGTRDCCITIDRK